MSKTQQEGSGGQDGVVAAASASDLTAMYHCDECGLDVPAENVRWSKDRRALCPRCEWPLDKVK